MTRHLEVDRNIEDWLADLPNSLPDRVVERLVNDLDRTPQWRRFGLPRRDQMNRFVIASGALAAIALIVVIGIRLVPGGGGLFGPAGQASVTPSSGPSVAPTPDPTIDPTPEPTLAASPTPSARKAADGNLQPGTYFLQPLQAADTEGNPLAVTFTVPEGWATTAGNAIYTADVGIQLEDISSLNGDPCAWEGTADDVSVGTTVDDLVNALVAQTAYEVSEPIDVIIGGYSGKRVDIVHPTEPFAGPGSDDAPECDGGQYRIWSSAILGPTPVYGQGPGNRWQTNILDVNGTRLVVVAGDFPETAAADRAELDAVMQSLVIEPAP